MMLDADTPVRTILDTYPASRKVFAWHGVATHGVAPDRELGDLCRQSGVDCAEVLQDLCFAMRLDGLDVECAMAVPPLSLPSPASRG